MARRRLSLARVIRSRPVWLAAFIVLLAAFTAACSGDGELSAEGVIIEVNATSLTTIESFVVRDNNGLALTFQVAPEAVSDPQHGFIAGHLRSHLAGPVQVFYREEDGLFLATRLEHR